MKSLILRSSVALACALSLAACGGGSGNLLLGGSVTGLTKSGLVVQNKTTGPDLPIPAGSSIFSFAELLHSDEDFEVLVKTQPPGANCVVKNGKGKTGAYNVTSVQIVCETFKRNLIVTGVDVDGLVLVNGPDRGVVAADKKSVTFQVPDGSPYGVTVLNQPAGRTCSVANGVGTIGATDVTLAATCI